MKGVANRDDGLTWLAFLQSMASALRIFLIFPFSLNVNTFHSPNEILNRLFSERMKCGLSISDVEFQFFLGEFLIAFLSKILRAKVSMRI